jgi:hypothetical protein
MLAFNSSALNLGAVVGPIVTGLALAAGGFALAAPWTAFLAGCALIIAYRGAALGRDLRATCW